MVLTRYYTLLDQGLFEEVIPIIRVTSLYEKSGGKNFEANFKVDSNSSQFDHIIIGWHNELPLQEIPQNELRYIVDTIVRHNAPAWNEE